MIVYFPQSFFALAFPLYPSVSLSLSYPASSFHLPSSNFTFPLHSSEFCLPLSLLSSLPVLSSTRSLSLCFPSYFSPTPESLCYLWEINLSPPPDTHPLTIFYLSPHPLPLCHSSLLSQYSPLFSTRPLIFDLIRSPLKTSNRLLSLSLPLSLCLTCEPR